MKYTEVLDVKKKVGESKALLGTYESFNLEAASLSTPSARKRDAKIGNG